MGNFVAISIAEKTISTESYHHYCEKITQQKTFYCEKNNTRIKKNYEKNLFNHCNVPRFS